MDVTIAGWAGTVPPLPELLARVAALRERGCEVQLLRADRILGRDHLAAAVARADRAFAAGRNVAASWPLEVLRYAAGERQIGRALDALGLAPGPARVASVVRGDPEPLAGLARELAWRRDDAALEFSPEKLAAWGLDAREVAALPPARRADLGLERVALADDAR